MKSSKTKVERQAEVVAAIVSRNAEFVSVSEVAAELGYSVTFVDEVAFDAYMNGKAKLVRTDNAGGEWCYRTLPQEEKGDEPDVRH